MMALFGRSRRNDDPAVDPDAEWQSIDWTAYTFDAIIHGRRVRYADIGQGPAVVLIHGQGGCWQWWLRVLPTIAKHSRAIAVDLPGFGESDPISTDTDVFAEHVASIRGLLDHLNLARAFIVGHSMGGLVSVQYACDHPSTVSGLVVVDGGGANVGPERLKWILAGLRVFHAVFAVPWVPNIVARTRVLRSILFSAGVHDPRTLSQPLALEILPRMAAPGFSQSLEAAAAAVNHVRPQAITCPSLLVWGAQDRILPTSTGTLLASQISGARLVTLDGVGHSPMIEAPKELNSLLVRFVGDPVMGRPASGSHSPAAQPRGRWWWFGRKRLSIDEIRHFSEGDRLGSPGTERNVEEA